MKLSAFLRSSVMTFFLVLISSFGVQAQITAFTYQGRLTDASMPASNGTYDFEFALYDANGTLVASNSIATTGITVTNGAFTAKLDFGLSAFNGADRYLEIRVKKPTDSNYTPLSPRQQINSAPYAIRSITAGTADTATNATNATNSNNADTLDNIDSSSFMQTNTTAFIRNQTAQQSADFNVSGTGKANIFDAIKQYNIDGNRVLSIQGLANLFVGFSAGDANTEGRFNSFIGYKAGLISTTGEANSFVGAFVGINNTTGSGNSFVGANSSLRNTTGASNSFVGISTGFYNTTGSENSFVGFLTGQNNTFGYKNSFFGSLAGRNNTTGNNNTIIGSGADVSGANLTFATAIGSEAIVSTSNTIVLGRSDGSDKVRIFGLGTAGSTQLCRNANNEISTCAPIAAFAEKDRDENATEIKTLREQVKQQQQQIDALIKLVCSQNTKADVCKQEK
jgi:hypothetical protein